MLAGQPKVRLTFVVVSSADDKQMPVVLAIHFAISSDGERRVGGAQGFQQENLLMRLSEDSLVALWERVDMPILAGDINQPFRADDGRVHAPLISARVAGVEGRILEGPFDVQVGIELRNKIRTVWNRSANWIAETAIRRCGIVIVFDDDRKRAVVRIHARRGVPTKRVGVDVVPAGVEMEKVAATVVIVVGHAKQYRAVRKHGWRSRRFVLKVGGTLGVGGGIYARCGPKAAGIGLGLDAGWSDRQKVAAPIGEPLLHRGIPLGCEIRVHSYDVRNHRVEVGHAHGVDCSIGCDRWSYVYRRAL